jgi:predicted AlkP superfamily pyrophosphatase or phosphodiesterase
MKLLVLDVVGLRPKDLPLAPRIRAVAEGGNGFAAPLRPTFPAVTCTVQASFLTGTTARDHGIVGNGWYFRDLAQVMFWKQANALIQKETVYAAARRTDPAFRCAKMFWWFNMYAPVASSVTPRPEYWADGRKEPDIYGAPPELPLALKEKLGAFPLFNFWGPMADIRSTRWIADASVDVIEREDPELALVYLPHLDYDHQRFGPDDPRSREQVAAVDAEAGKVIDAARARGAEVIVLSEYGIEDVDRPVFLNRLLHERGLLRVQETGHGQLLDAGASRAFAVCDHQAAHVYVREPEDVPAVRKLLAAEAGVARVLDRSEQAELGIDHERSGELVCVAEKGCWFAYHYWLDEARRPDFAPTVDIHRKPGYDPTELFFDPKLRWPKLRAARRVLQKKLGFRYLVDVIGTDPSIVRGSHGRLYEDDEAGAVIVSSIPRIPGLGDVVDATQVRALIESGLAG